MSVTKRSGKYLVRFRDETGKERGRTFKLKGDADLFDAEVKRRRALGGDLMRDLMRSDLTLDQFVGQGFRGQAATYSVKTQRMYKWALLNHLAELGDVPIADLNVPRLSAHQHYLLENGRTPNTVRQVFMHLSGIMQVAVEHGLIPANPVRAMRKVPATPRDEVRPLTPTELETLANQFTGRDRIIVLLGGHLGLRPVEIRSVRWEGFDGATLTVGRTQTKSTAARTRVIDVPKATAAELKAWRLASGGREEIVDIGEAGLRLFAYRHLSPTALALFGRDDVTTYTLRHTHGSALHHADYSVPRAAKRMGHSPVVHITHYAHVMEQMGATRYANLDDLIAAARELCTQGVQATETSC